ncbi:AsmA-like C-terminal region-containing protein [Oceanimonas pelagia]|uniref:AsmA-like C-terminal region-containing protein n=1 Tax=Oceanimonas pelagia TaxID=3028314 RepID=A0AA50KPD5_9GAMM|nr:AsmA-like C-terminal region-containing protein [Oceanimonas pelagia]WMC10625.1 AsmA-like C-terminal region-containing protein [Oceanimonas pelagia]
MKKLARRGLTGLLVLLLGGWLLLNVLDVNQLKKPVLTWLNENTELGLSVGRLEFNPLSPYKLLAEDVRLGDWFSARQIYLELEQLAPLAGRTEVAILDIIDGRLNLERAQAPALPASLADIHIQELNTKNLALAGQGWEAGGIELRLRDWQPRRQGQWQWEADARLSVRLRQLSHPALELAQLDAGGQLRQGRLELDDVRGRLFGGLVSGRLVLDPRQRELRLERPQFSQVRLQLGESPALPDGWRLLLNRAALDDVSLTTPRLTVNGMRGELRDLEWNGRSLPEGRGNWQADEATLDWLRLDQHRLHWLGDGERQGMRLNGQAWEGSIEAELGWYPGQGRLDIDELQLAGNKLVWQPDITWSLPEVRIHKLNLSRTELLSLDDTLPLSLLDGNLFITDLAWSAGLWRPLSEQARLEGSIGDLAWNSLIARQAAFSARLTDEQWLLDTLTADWLDGHLTLSGSMASYAPHTAHLELTGQNWQLRHLSNWLRAGQGFAGDIDIRASLTGEPGTPASWQGELTLDGRDIFVEQLGLDAWLRNRLGEDYATPKQVDAALAALDMRQNDGFLYRLDLHGPVRDGRWRLNGSAVQSVRHLLALRGEVNLSGSLDLDLGAINDAGCRELAIRLAGDWHAPRLRLHQPALPRPCRPWYSGPVPYPAAGLPGNLVEAVRALPAP